MSLTDEIMEAVEDYVVECLLGAQGHPAVPVTAREAIRSRLSALETELNDLRGGRLCDECGLPMALIDNPYGLRGKFWNCYNPNCYTAPIKYRLADPPRVEQHRDLVNGLPCSNVSDWEDETGG